MWSRKVFNYCFFYLSASGSCVTAFPCDGALGFLFSSPAAASQPVILFIFPYCWQNETQMVGTSRWGLWAVKTPKSDGKPKKWNSPPRFSGLMWIEACIWFILCVYNLGVKTCAISAFPFLNAFTFQVCPLQILSCCLIICFISSTFCVPSYCCLCSNHQTTTSTTSLLCCSVLCRCLSLL